MNDHHVKYVLVGGGLASSAAARAIRALDADGELLLVGQEVNRAYHRPPRGEEYLLGKQGRDALFTVPDEWFAENGVALRTGRRATHLDTNRHTVTLDSGGVSSFDR